MGDRAVQPDFATAPTTQSTVPLRVVIRKNGGSIVNLRIWSVAITIAIAAGCATGGTAVNAPDAWAVEVRVLPGSFAGRTLLVEGELFIIGGKAWFASAGAADAVSVVLPDNLDAASNQDAVKLLRRLLDDSRATPGTSGSNVTNDDGRRAWVSVHGKIEPRPAEPPPANALWLKSTHQIVVDRVVAARHMDATKRK